MKIEKFLARHHLTRNDIMDTIQEVAPQFGKEQLSMAVNYKRYGVELSKDAWKALKEKYEPPKPKKEKKKYEWVQTAYEPSYGINMWHCGKCHSLSTKRTPHCPFCGEKLE